MSKRKLTNRERLLREKTIDEYNSYVEIFNKFNVELFDNKDANNELDYIHSEEDKKSAVDELEESRQRMHRIIK